MAVSPIDITKALGGMEFPASKQELIDHAGEKKAKGDVVDVLNQLPDKQYENMRDVEHEFGKVK